MEKLINPEEWDVVVIGAGPAGSIAAFEIAKSGCSVLLIDKANFPRTKICGSCLNLRSLSLLRQAGIDLTSQLQTSPIRKFHFAANQKHLSLAFSGRSVSREKFDYFLVHQAVKKGARFLPAVRAVMGETDGPFRTVHLLNGNEIQKIKSKIVVVANGLSGSPLKEGVHLEVQPKSRIGIGTIVNEGPAFYEPGTIYMAYSRNGYVGTVRLEDGRIDIAAALHPVLVRSRITQNIRMIWKEAGFPEIDFTEQTQWLGTPFMTRSRKQLSGDRFFMIGDAAGYTEPFTGEGISWALASGIAIGPIVIRALQGWSSIYHKQWNRSYYRFVGRRQRISKWMAASLRNPLLVQCAVEVISRVPFLTNFIVKGIER